MSRYEVVITIENYKFLSCDTYNKFGIKCIKYSLRNIPSSIDLEIITVEEGDKRYRTHIPEIRRQCE